MSVVAAGTAAVGLVGAFAGGGSKGGGGGAPSLPMSQANGDTTFTFNNGTSGANDASGLLPKVMLVVVGVSVGVLLMRIVAHNRGK